MPLKKQRGLFSIFICNASTSVPIAGSPSMRMKMEVDEGEEEVCLFEAYERLSDAEKNALKEMLTPVSFFRCVRTVTDDCCR